MKCKFFWLICTLSIFAYSQENTEEWDTLDASDPEIEEIVLPPVYNDNTPTDTILRSNQEQVNLQETIPPAPARPIAQSVIGGVLSGNGALILILDIVLIGLNHSAYGEVPDRSKPQIAIYSIAGGVQALCGIGLIAGAQPKWKEYNEWEAKYKYTAKNNDLFQINITLNF